MEKERKYLLLSYFALIAIIFFFTPIFAVYRYGDGVPHIIIVLSQWLLARKLWEQRFGFKKTMSLWILMSFLLLLTIFLRDTVIVFFGKEGWHHSIKYYVLVGSASTFWWAMVNVIATKIKKGHNNKNHLQSMQT